MPDCSAVQSGNFLSAGSARQFLPAPSARLMEPFAMQSSEGHEQVRPLGECRIAPRIGRPAHRPPPSSAVQRASDLKRPLNLIRPSDLDRLPYLKRLRSPPR